MVRYVSPAEYQRLMREQQRRIEQYNRDVDRHNSEVRRGLEQYNREVAAHNREVERRRQEQQRAIDNHNRQVAAHNRDVARNIDNYNRDVARKIDQYNSAVRAHNSQVIANRQRAVSALQSLQRQPVVTRYETFRSSTLTLNSAFQRLDASVGGEQSDADDEVVLELPARENANSLEVMNALLRDESPADVGQANLQNSELNDVLRRISVDLDARWRGALFALHPQNPDAARHFCTSAREVITQIIELGGPDADVLRALPDCPLHEGRPTRRTKVQFILQRRGLGSTELGDFVEADVENVLGLFKVFNPATHGEAGKYDINKLVAIKTRVEGGIMFLSRLVR